MVHGRQGLRLEAWKFAVYLSLPIAASLTFNEPRVQRFCADYFQFLKYPSNPNTNLREEFEELAKKRQLEREQRKAYTDELKKMHEGAAEKRRLREQAVVKAENAAKNGWTRWLRLPSLRQKQQQPVDTVSDINNVGQ
jgi:hypothetical protein